MIAKSIPISNKNDKWDKKKITLFDLLNNWKKFWKILYATSHVKLSLGYSSNQNGVGWIKFSMKSTCIWHWSATEKKLCLNLIRFYQHNLHLFPSLFAFNKIGLSKTRNNTTNAIQWSHIRFLYCWANSCFKAFLLPIDDQFSLWRTRKIRSYHWHCCCSLHSGSFKRKKSYSSKRIKEF